MASLTSQMVGETPLSHGSEADSIVYTDAGLCLLTVLVVLLDSPAAQNALTFMEYYSTYYGGPS
jgi:hypothetical protein